ncbi:MAG: bifunctional UDP-N-acetylmuramoyl-tripeptide:D-alanyl-D-alanine ligase/alanine racemase [Bacteroidetes bacterium]|nr:MAG: bifunctional UDP-N-acetylmuramoyl-tripeptide:D-alanyl-D-alanine ligase/alanine racemase [Bacteroidota bacterium]
MLGTPYTIQEIAEATLARDLFQGLPERQSLRYIAYDTRRISHGRETVFVALRTANRDGHDFIPEAMARGVRSFIVDRPLAIPEIQYALVDDTLEALQIWALQHRQRFEYPVIGITGSNGKTTVKEWLATLLEADFQLVKSPMSYNSQLGVALSLLQMRPGADLALIEAGVSRQGEMAVLEEMIRPTLGIFTHLGPAHAEGFASEAEKLHEKAGLFARAGAVLARSAQAEVLAELKDLGIPLHTVGEHPGDQLQVRTLRTDPDSWYAEVQEPDRRWPFSFPARSRADRTNVLLAILAARHLGLSPEVIQSRLPLLYPVEMRSELITDNPEITLINDSYNCDPDSVRNALNLLRHTKVQARRIAILTDIPHQGVQQVEVQQQLLDEARAIADEVITVGPVFAGMNDGADRSFETTEALLAAIRYEDFVDSTVLLKGARAFALERVLPRLQRKLNATHFAVNLRQLGENFRLLKAQLPPQTRTMGMVKALAYGSGTWEIAAELAQTGVDYLAVAFASEAIELREAGIELPIMVMNPDPSSLEALIQYDIEPEVSNLDLLRQYLRAIRLTDRTRYRIHLKIETGMGRLGFRYEALPELVAFIRQHPDLEIVSVLTHLAAADDPAEDAFSATQVQRFEAAYAYLQAELGLFAWRHVLNTAGILRFPAWAFEMVRMGIGLYGLAPVDTGLDLQEIGSLRSLITQIQTHPAGSGIGYGRAQVTTRKSRIATLPIGYADGIPRSVGEGKAHFLLRGQRVPTFGRICMDMLMLDVTDVPEAQAGDEVVLFGWQGETFLSVAELAEAAGTIPYEILVRISPRVRRVYVRD